MKTLLETSEEFKNYLAIAEGKLNPINFSHKDDTRKIEELILQTSELTLPLTDKTADYQPHFKLIDFKLLGYQNPDHVNVFVRRNHESNTENVIIALDVSYLRKLVHNTSRQIKCQLISYYLAFIHWEYERIKTRASHIIDIMPDRSLLSLYADKCQRKIDHMIGTIEETRHTLQFQITSTSRAQLYIHICLLRSLIKTRQLYQQLFHSFSETQRPPAYTQEACYYLPDEEHIPAISALSLVKESEEVYTKKNTNYPNSIARSKNSKTPWSGKMNQLTTFLEDLNTIKFQVYDEEGKPVSKPYTLMDQPVNFLIDFISENFTNNQRKAISRKTLETYFKPSRHDKRAKYPNRFNLAEFIRLITDNRIRPCNK